MTAKKLKQAKPSSNISGQVYMLIERIKSRGLTPLAVFLTLAVPTGLYLVMNVPAFWAPDGAAHVSRVFQIAATGIRPVFIGREVGNGYGGPVPITVNELKTLEIDIVIRNGGAGAERQSKLLTPQDKKDIAGLSHQKIGRRKVLVSYVNTAAYSPIAYAPHVAGIILGWLLNFNLGHTLLLAGLLGFLTYLLCVGYALYTLRSSQLKWAIMTVALLPVVVFNSTLITADSFLVSISLLFSALILKALFNNSKLTMLDKILLFGAVLVLPQTKSVYFPLVFLVLFIPKSQWSKRSNYWWWTGTALTISMTAFAIWSGVVADVAASNGLVRGDMVWHYGDAKLQQHFILSHPFGFLHAVFNSFLYQSKFFMDTYFGWLGFTYLQIPGVAVIAGYLALGLSVLLAGAIRLKKYMAAVFAAVIVCIVIVMFAVFYVAYTPPMHSMVEGVQGRYFLPLTVLTIATFAQVLPDLRIADKGLDKAKYLLIALSAFCLLFSVLRYGLAISS